MTYSKQYTEIRELNVSFLKIYKKKVSILIDDPKKKHQIRYNIQKENLDFLRGDK